MFVDARVVTVRRRALFRRQLESDPDQDRRSPRRRARAARRLAVQHRHRSHYQPLRDRCRRHHDHHRGPPRGLHRVRRDERDRRLRVAHAQRRGRAGSFRHRRCRQDHQRRLERGQPQMARAAAQPIGDGPIGDLYRHLHRAPQRRLQRHAGLHLHRRPQGGDDRPHRRRGQGVQQRASTERTS